MLTLLEVMGILLGLYWLGLGLRHWLSGNGLYNFVFDFEEPVEKSWEPRPWPLKNPVEDPPVQPAPEPVVRQRRSMPHHNWLALNTSEEQCQGEFERMDARTWQCTVCHSLHFEKIQGEAS
jgi:hypothetical protein